MFKLVSYLAHDKAIIASYRFYNFFVGQKGNDFFMTVNYNETLNLPKTDFPMRGNLPEREPVIQKKWDDEKVYQGLIEKNKDKPTYILHDGPPYANGDIHIGHALNKILSEKTGQPIERIQIDTERDNFMGALEAKEYGLVDAVIAQRPSK